MHGPEYFWIHHGVALANRNMVVQLQTMITDLGITSQLIMFLTGMGGGGKSKVIDGCYFYCRGWCKKCNIAFDENVFMITATTGTSAVNLKCGTGTTIHSKIAFFQRAKISDQTREVFQDTNTIVIDEVSFLDQKSIGIIHDHLCDLAKDNMCHLPYGGFNVVFTGDFAQLPPCSGVPLYKHHCIFWHELVNKVVYLDKGHQFVEDPQWGSLLSRLRMGQITVDDIDMINTRVITSSTVLPTGATYACTTNAGRNNIADAVFFKHVMDTHPTETDPMMPPSHTIIIVGKLSQKNGKPWSDNVHKWIGNMCGDAHCEDARRK